MCNFIGKICLIIFIIAQVSCDKLVDIKDPIDTITANQVFSSDLQARTALAGVYSGMANGGNASLIALIGGFSSDELNYRFSSSNAFVEFLTNNVLAENAQSFAVWTAAYKTIYGANSVIEGIAASTASLLTANARKQMTGEALFIRAFTFFYLVNLYGDVPLALTIDFNKTRTLPRSPTVNVYRQIIDDLLVAQSLLAPNNPFSPSDERIIPDKWAATALLARVYLFTGDFSNAAKQAGDVIANAARFTLEDNLNRAFLKDSKEAIWQLKQASNSNNRGSATPEGYALIPPNFPGDPLFSNIQYPLTDELLNAFEPGDKRRISWVEFSPYSTPTAPGPFYFPYKYKTGPHNRVVNGAPTEYSMLLRLSELYLIRAEAIARGGGNPQDVVTDLNVVRRRAGLDDLPNTLTQPQLLAAIAQERQVEFFVEGGHRWLDLKRTGEALTILPQLPLKQPWRGDYQLLYPIPPQEIVYDPFLIQNPGY